AQGSDAGRGRVMGAVRLQRGHRRRLYVGGRVEVGVADPEVDDVAALLRQTLDLREHGEGVFGTQAARAVRKSHRQPIGGGRRPRTRVFSATSRAGSRVGRSASDSAGGAGRGGSTASSRSIKPSPWRARTSRGHERANSAAVSSRESGPRWRAG